MANALENLHGRARCRSLSPDGSQAVSASLDNTLRVWSLTDGRCRVVLEGHTDSVEAVLLTPDGRFVVSASRDKTIKLWDFASGQCEQTIEGHTDCVDALALDAHGSLVSGSYDGTIRVWNLANRQCVRTLRKQSRLAMWPATVGDQFVGVGGFEQEDCLWVRGVAIASNGRWAISASYDQTVEVWDIETCQVIAAFHGDSPFTCCAVAPDGKTVVAGDQSGRVHFLRLVGVD